MLRIGFNARPLAAQHVRGWTRYSICLLRELAALDCRLVLLSDKRLTAALLEELPAGSFESVVAPRMRYITWEQAWLPWACRRSRVSLLHSPLSFGLPVFAGCPTVLTLHDAIDVAFEPPGVMTLRERFHRASHFAARASASRIITVSEHAKRDIREHFGVPEARLRVIHEAADVSLLSGAEDDAAVLDSVGVHGRFVFYVGGFERRKNVEFLASAFLEADLADVTLVLAGARVTEDTRELARRSAGRIAMPGYVDDATLGALYRRAECFVYPSLYEGFGLQLCEAMSQACPVLAADATSLPEVLGDGGELFDLSSTARLVDLLRRVCTDAAYRAELKRRSFGRSAHFSWRRTAEQTLAVYRELI